MSRFSRGYHWPSLCNPPTPFSRAKCGQEFIFPLSHTWTNGATAFSMKNGRASDRHERRTFSALSRCLFVSHVGGSRGSNRANAANFRFPSVERCHHYYFLLILPPPPRAQRRTQQTLIPHHSERSFGWQRKGWWVWSMAYTSASNTRKTFPPLPPQVSQLLILGRVFRVSKL